MSGVDWPKIMTPRNKEKMMRMGKSLKFIYYDFRV
jgi:hypothetical protein